MQTLEKKLIQNRVTRKNRDSLNGNVNVLDVADYSCFFEFEVGESFVNSFIRHYARIELILNSST